MAYVVFLFVKAFVFEHNNLIEKCITIIFTKVLDLYSIHLQKSMPDVFYRLSKFAIIQGLTYSGFHDNQKNGALNWSENEKTCIQCNIEMKMCLFHG